MMIVIIVIASRYHIPIRTDTSLLALTLQFDSNTRPPSTHSTRNSRLLRGME